MTTIVFRCERCGSRFEVDGRLAGRKGRCKTCGERIAIPEPLALAPVAAEPEPVRSRVAEAPRPVSWVEALTTNVALAPLTRERLPKLEPRAVRREPNLDESSGPYALVKSRAYRVPRPRPTSPPAGFVTTAWRRLFRSLQKLFRRINESAYIASIPFIGLILMGIVVHNRSLALLGATVVVLLNVGRLVSGLLNMAAAMFKEGPIQGILFLIPPLTFVYLFTNWNTLRKPFRRVVEPVVTVGLVVLAFTFVPWLATGGRDSSSGVAERLRGEAGALQQDIRGKVEQAEQALEGAAKQAPSVDLEALGGRVRDAAQKSLGRGNP